jgi:hypothetical protein
VMKDYTFTMENVSQHAHLTLITMMKPTPVIHAILIV